jgi:outer membrane protein OmpA-like peptidoglycan-associated protein
MSRWYQAALTLILPVLLLACAPATRVILLPEPSGRATAVEVQSASGKRLLSEPYQTAEVGQNGQIQRVTLDAQAVEKRYGMPFTQPPLADDLFLLYFEVGGSVLTPESAASVPEILARAAMRPGGEITVIGHTDRVGAIAANDALSLRRAQTLVELIIAKGFKPELVEAIGRGERAPLVVTEDEVPEPRNRRAEIRVR